MAGPTDTDTQMTGNIFIKMARARARVSSEAGHVENPRWIFSRLYLYHRFLNFPKNHQNTISKYTNLTTHLHIFRLLKINQHDEEPSFQFSAEKISYVRFNKLINQNKNRHNKMRVRRTRVPQPLILEPKFYPYCG